MRYDQKIIQHNPNNRNSLSTTPQKPSATDRALQ